MTSQPLFRPVYPSAGSIDLTFLLCQFYVAADIIMWDKLIGVLAQIISTAAFVLRQILVALTAPTSSERWDYLPL